MSNIVGYIFSESEGVFATPKIKSSNRDWIVMETILQEADEINRNRRKYAKRVLSEAVGQPRVCEMMKKRQLVGEAGHPISEDPKRQMQIDQTRISHLITETRWDGNYLMGTVMTANTAVGRDFKGLIEQGYQAAFSMRGMGNVIKEANGYIEVGSPLNILTWDNVIFPSHKNAYMTSLKEDVNVFDEKNDSAIMLPLEESFLKFVIQEQKLHTLSESMNFDVNINNTKLSEDGKAVMICNGASCAKIMLENYVRMEFDRALGLKK
jgi:hypothetical protein